ncbi:MAG TPA: SIS domain-containing protein [Jatrophihabitans sp.]|nr:SIS domain-containing protein [Jatrophihabitans sp.]
MTTTTAAPGTLPLKPIEADFVETVEKTIAQRDTIEQLVDEVVTAGLRNVYFVGAGGSLIASYPAFYLLARKVDFPVFQVQSDELNTGQPAALGAGSLVVLASYTGTTKETVAAARFAKSRGAKVVIVGKEGSLLAEASDVALTGDSDIAEVLIAYALLQRVGVPGDYDAVWQAVAALPKALRSAQEESEDLVHEIAEALKDEPITYVLGSGPNYGWAYGLAMCYLQEMQWKHAAAYDSGEFFQGAFEVINDEVPVILLLGEDASRPMGERAKAFLDKYTKKAHLIDTAALTLPGVPSEQRGDVSPLALRAVIGRLAKHYESVRGHDLEQRHYMFKVEY